MRGRNHCSMHVLHLSMFSKTRLQVMWRRMMCRPVRARGMRMRTCEVVVVDAQGRQGCQIRPGLWQGTWCTLHSLNQVGLYHFVGPVANLSQDASHQTEQGPACSARKLCRQRIPTCQVVLAELQRRQGRHAGPASWQCACEVVLGQVDARQARHA